MRESKRDSDDRYDFRFMSQKELDVGDILLDLGETILQLEFRKRFSFNWGLKKKRSGKDSATSPPRQMSSPCLPMKTSHEGEETDGNPKVKAEANSPLTPLAFPPSESDEKSRLHSLDRDSKKRKKDKLMENIDKLTQSRGELTKQLDTVKEYYKKLMDFNKALKAKRDEMNARKENPPMEIDRGFHLGMRMDQHQQQYHPPAASPLPRQQPPSPSFINHQTAYYPPPHLSGKFQHYPHGQPMLPAGMVNRAEMFDLNLPPQDSFVMVFDTSQPFDLSGASRSKKYAEARKTRMLKINQKKDSSALVQAQKRRRL